MSITAAPCWRVTDTSSSSTCAWTVTSRAVVGSSAITNLGSHDSAIAIMARWRMPPENSWGKLSTRRCGCGMPTSSSISIARFLASAFEICRCDCNISMICLPTV